MKICLVTSFPPSRDALNEYGFHIASELRRIPEIELTILGDDYSPPQPELDGFKVVRCWKFNSLRNPRRVLEAIGRPADANRIRSEASREEAMRTIKETDQILLTDLTCRL